MRSGTVILATLAIVVVVSAAASAQDNSKTRVIVLTPAATCTRCYGGPSGVANHVQAMVTIHGYPTGDAGLHLNVRGLLAFGPDEPGTYALYLSTSANPAVDGGVHPYRFNVNWDGEIVLWTGFGDADQIPFDAPTLSAFIAIEPDDGRTFEAPNDASIIQLVGTSTK
jgi:hypothetical protein